MSKKKQQKVAQTNTPSHPDAPLIRACMEYARALRGASGAFEVDPTGDSDFARAIDDKALNKARKASRFAVNYLPSTLDGLRAKAAAALVGIDLDRGPCITVLRSLCADVERFHKAMSLADTKSTTTEIAS